MEISDDLYANGGKKSKDKKYAFDESQSEFDQSSLVVTR